MLEIISETIISEYNFSIILFFINISHFYIISDIFLIVFYSYISIMFNYIRALYYIPILIDLSFLIYLFKLIFPKLSF